MQREMASWSANSKIEKTYQLLFHFSWYVVSQCSRVGRSDRLIYGEVSVGVHNLLLNVCLRTRGGRECE